MKIAIFETNQEEKEVLERLFAEKLPEAEVKYIEEKLTQTNIAQAYDCEAVSVFINSEIKKEIVDQLPNLKFIATRSTGFDHVDTRYCLSKKIAVANVPAYGSRTVAEYTFALMLGLSRKTFQAYHMVKERHELDYSSFRGFNLEGKTLGVIGTGRIGLNVIEIAIRGFKMKVVAYDPYPKQDRASELGFSYADLNSLLSASDIVTIHTPYNQDTHHLINKENIGLFKKGSLLINTARGEIVDTQALLSGIKDGILSGVGLDVLEGEREMKDEFARITDDDGVGKLHTEDIKTLLEDHILMETPQTAITPHMAFFTTEAKEEILHTTVESFAGFAQGKPINLVQMP